MHILFIGYSRIVQKRVLPALVHVSSIKRIDIASRSSTSNIFLPDSCEGEVFDNYDIALSESRADIVYISTVNSEHARWAEKALNRGFHVIVDKPAFTSFETATRLVKLAQGSNLCLAEATVYAFHPQIQLAKDIFSKANSKPSRLTALLSFPPLNPEDFRYRKDLGGGALWDTGPYAVSVGRLFFESEPEEVFCKILSRGGKDDVDISFSVLATYPDGKSMVGHFGFTTEYINQLNLLGPDVSMTMDRIFTTTPELENEIRVRQRNETLTVKAPKADSFSIFIQRIIDAVQTGKHKELSDNLLLDASVLHRLRLAANT